jgi:diadenosine tetraphosphatase ApaH/serine/threonine PP2A family protein phosphatase
MRTLTLWWLLVGVCNKLQKEVLLKYDDRMFKRIQKVFNQLPIAALIRNKIFVTHGGLFREPDLTIDEIRRYAPVLPVLKAKRATPTISIVVH